MFITFMLLLFASNLPVTYERKYRPFCFILKVTDAHRVNPLSVIAGPETMNPDLKLNSERRNGRLLYFMWQPISQQEPGQSS